MSYSPTPSAPLKKGFPWATIIGSIIGGLALIWAVGWGIYTYVYPNSNLNSNSPLSSSTINLADVLNQYNGFGTTLEKQNFIANYYGKEITGSGSFSDIGGEGSGYLVAIDIANSYVTCTFDASSGPELLLFTKGEGIDFSGTLQDGVFAGSGNWVISNCSLLN